MNNNKEAFMFRDKFQNFKSIIVKKTEGNQAIVTLEQVLIWI